MPGAGLESTPYASRARLVESQATSTGTASEMTLQAPDPACYLTMSGKVMRPWREASVTLIWLPFSVPGFAMAVERERRRAYLRYGE